MRATETPEHVDVLIIGGGISGIDAAYHLRNHRPGTSFAVLEGADDIGGTWHTHRFPGIRSDSDLFTFGFSWKPWTGVPIATASEIMAYLNEAIDENDLRDTIRLNSRVVSAAWSSGEKRWTVTLQTGEDTAPKQMTCGFLWMCAGYYRHEQGYTPQWPGMADFEGQIVHPQNWPEDLDYAGKNVVVIGSGATAATLIPAMAPDAGSITMLQRSPTYYFARPMMDEFNQTLSALNLPAEQYHDIMRRKFLRDSELTVKRAREEPEALARDLLAGVNAYLGENHGLERHFTPSYPPWRQRLALLPEGDMFTAIRQGEAQVITDEIDRFLSHGLRLKSGQEIDADIVVTATGLSLSMFGRIALSVDGTAVDVSQHVTHRGLMFSDVPNFATVFGYLRSSWTLRADLVSIYICRMLDHMDARDARSITPKIPQQDRDMPLRPWIDPEDFNPGYIMRSLDQLPRQGDRQPWIMTQDFFRDRVDLPEADLDDGTLIYG